MNIQSRRLRVVTLDSAYETWSSAPTRAIFCDLVEMKLRGYQDNYFPGVLPLDGTDFIGSHHLICEETKGQLIPLMGFRSITVDRAARHKTLFPALGLTTASGSKNHVSAVERIMALCVERRRRLSYESSWTILPRITKDPQTTDELHRIFRAIKLLHLEADAIDESLLGATLRFKVPKIFQAMGYKPLALDGVELEPIPVPSMGNEKVLVVHLEQRSVEGMRFAEQYRALWNDRIVIAARTDELKIAA